MARYPTIDYRRCVSDQACVEGCPEQVIRWDDRQVRIEITTIDACPPACRACADLCPLDAIHFTGETSA